MEAKKKITDLINKIARMSEKGYDFLLGRMYFTSNDHYKNLLVITPMISSLILDSNKEGTNWILTGISCKKIKPFDTNVELTMSNLANGRVTLEFNNSVLMQKIFFFIV